MSTALTRIEGTLPEKVEAFKQMAACASSLMFPGYDSPQKVMAAAWMGDALGVHPAAFMQGVHCMPIDNKTVLQPKWEFENALLRSRLPGFDYEVIENSEAACELKGWADGISPQRVRYTIKDAKRQGIYKRTWTTSDKEMCWKSCFHRLAKRIGAHVLMGLPPMVGVDEGEEPASLELPESAPPEASSAVVVDEKPTDYVKALSDLLSDLYGKQASKDVRLRACGLAMTALLREMVPTADAVIYKRADQIGPVDAKNIYTWLLKKYPDRKLGKPAEPDEQPEQPQSAGVAQGTEAAPDAPPKDEPSTEDAPAAVEPEPVEDVEPSMDEGAEPEPEPEPEDTPAAREAQMVELARLVEKAKLKLKVKGKAISVVTKNNAGSWVNSSALVAACGWPPIPVMLRNSSGAVVLELPKLRLLCEKLEGMLR